VEDGRAVKVEGTLTIPTLRVRFVAKLRLP